jgi:penicillin-binding protein 2
VVVSLFGALFARLWYLQVMSTEEYQQVTQAQAVQQLAEEAPRGRILDAKGRVLVDNRTSLVVTMERGALDDLEEEEADELKLRLASELTGYGVPTKVTRIERRLEDPQYSPLQPIPVASDVPEEFQVFLAERADEFPGVEVRRESVRTYPNGTAAAHVLGYVGRINEEELAARMGTPEDPVEGVTKPYQPDSNIGKGGVEALFEDDLRGTPARTTVEVDANGRVVRELENTPARPGYDVQLTIDIDVQQAAERSLADQLEALRGGRTSDGKERRTPAGAVVVLDPHDGAVVAMASYPTFDPAEFVNGISQARLDALTTGDPSQNALVNRAIGGLYAPGSTFKPITALAGLRHGTITPELTINDPGYWIIQNCSGDCDRQNAGRTPYGSVDLRRSLTVSSDTFYYRIGDVLHQRRDELGYPVQDVAREFGLGSNTGFPLAGELAGVVPDAAWKAELVEALGGEGDPTWYPGDATNVSIGQGDVLATPLQMANVYAALANGGTLHTPRIGARVLAGGTDPDAPDTVVREIAPTVAGTIDLPPQWLDPIRDGLAGVTRSGTAEDVFAGWDQEAWPVAGKTGTAEVNDKADFSLFAAYGPLGDPGYSVFAVLEEAGFGGEAAAPVVRRTLAPVAGQSPDPGATVTYTEGRD